MEHGRIAIIRGRLQEEADPERAKAAQAYMKSPMPSLGVRVPVVRRLVQKGANANLADKEFFIRKAIGWTLREYAKTDPQWVRDYVETRWAGLSQLSLREAMKHLG